MFEFGLQLTHTVRNLDFDRLQSISAPSRTVPDRTAPKSSRRFWQLVSLHEQRVIVKDLKPANVLVEHAAGGWEPTSSIDSSFVVEPFQWELFFRRKSSLVELFFSSSTKDEFY